MGNFYFKLMEQKSEDLAIDLVNDDAGASFSCEVFFTELFPKLRALTDNSIYEEIVDKLIYFLLAERGIHERPGSTYGDGKVVSDRR